MIIKEIAIYRNPTMGAKFFRDLQTTVYKTLSCALSICKSTSCGFKFFLLNSVFIIFIIGKDIETPRWAPKLLFKRLGI